MIAKIILAAALAATFGNPHSANPYWKMQTGPDCVEQSVRVAVDEVKHRSAVSESAIDAYAQRAGIYDPTIGTYSAAWPLLISHYGAHYSGPSSMSKTTLERDLNAKKAIIALINAETIWNPQGYVTAAPTTAADHALVVQAVNKKTGAVTLSDGGIPTGRGEVVSWKLFSKAWAASGYEAVAVSA